MQLSLENPCHSPFAVDLNLPSAALSELNLEIRSADGENVDCICHLLVESTDAPDDNRKVRTDGFGKATFEISPDEEQIVWLVTRPIEAGYWCGWVDGDTIDLSEPNSMRIVCDRLSGIPAFPWWLEILNVDRGQNNRGKGVRIGVVDTSLKDIGGLEHVESLTQASRQEVSDDPIEAGPSHGEMVCRILADRSACPECEPIVPSASVVLALSGYSPSTWSFSELGSEYPPGVDPVAVTNAVFDLVFKGDVDIINLSLGTHKEPDDVAQGMRIAIEAATSRGIVVVCAAGNQRLSTVAFPARLDDCVAVGAFGLTDWGGEHSIVKRYSEIDRGSDEHGKFGQWRIYSWYQSAFGTGLDLVAPGVGLVISRQGLPAYDITGTSFAAPLVVGVLAINLAKKRISSGDWTLSARKVLNEMMSPASGHVHLASFNEMFQGNGILSLT